MNTRLVVDLQKEYNNGDIFQWPSSVRRDPKFSPQLYFFRVQPKDSQSDCFIFSHAIADPNKESAVRMFDFLKRKFTNDHTSAAQEKASLYNKYVIDERNKKLYLMFGKALPHLHIEAKLKVFDLHFDAPDKLGYRRITVEEHPNTQFNIDFEPAASIGNSCMAFAIFPSNGQLITYHWLAEKHASICAPAALAPPKEGDKSVVCALSQATFATATPSRDVIPQQFHFSRLNHLLVLFIPYSEIFDRNANIHASSQTKSNKYVFVLAYNSDAELVHKLKIDPIQLIAKYFPRNVFASLCSIIPTNIRNKHTLFGMGLELLGHMYKYVLFALHRGYILCVKWPRNWYTFEELPVAKLSHLFCFPAIFDQHQQLSLPRPKGLMISYVVGAELYFKLIGGPGEQLHAVNLGPKLKDYRRCAHCDKVEDKKRRNKRGQRIAKFKVCRKCKSLNLHLFHTDPSLMCHYCSDQCQQMDWNKHKIIHKRHKMDRENGNVPSTYEEVI